MKGGGLLRRAVAALLAVGAVASCTSILKLDGYEDAVDQLCRELATCYKDGFVDCKSHLQAGLEKTGAQSDEQRAAWLQTFVDSKCATGCKEALDCLDDQPVCLGNGAACTQREECCGFRKGTADCQGKQCCEPQGNDCTSDADCCSGLKCNQLDGETRKTCGGVSCGAVGASCDDGSGCCTGYCKANSCALCQAKGAPCESSEDCCGLFCGASQRCSTTECAAKGDACSSDADCCGGLPCHDVSGGSSTPDLRCTTDGCATQDADCASDAECCSGACNRSTAKCVASCKASGDTGCASDDDCCYPATCQNPESGGVCKTQCSTGTCAKDGDCCSGKCNPDLAQCDCVAEADRVCDHTPCDPGGPMQMDCQSVSACVVAVCKADPFCCCQTWDSFCITTALAQPECADACADAN